MAAAAVPLALFGMGVSAIGTAQQGQANARTARQNARLARAAAEDALQRGEQEAGRIRTAGDVLVGRQVAAYGHAGVDVGSGTPAKTIAQTSAVAELDAQMARTNAFRRAWGYEQQARGLYQQARDLRSATYLNLVGTFVGGAGSMMASRKA